MGGGTLVGTSYFRGLISRGLALTGNNGSYAIGVGVDDPVFNRRMNASDKDELKRWLPRLWEFRIVSVRGPEARNCCPTSESTCRYPVTRRSCSRGPMRYPKMA